MANAIYPAFKEQILQGGVNMSTADIRVLLYDTAISGYVSTHVYVGDLNAADIIARTAAGLGTKTFTNGTFDAADTSFSAVTGDISEALIIYVYNASDAAARLIAYIDTGVTGLPVTPNGGNINVTWDAAGIFTI